MRRLFRYEKIVVKSKPICLIKLHAVRDYGRSGDIYLCISNMRKTLVRRSASRSLHFLSRKNPSSTHGLDNWENVKSPILAGNLTTTLGLSSCNLHNDSSGEINPTRCNNCVYSSQWLYSTCFGWQFHPSSVVHMLYMASGRQVYLCCNFVSIMVVLSL